MNLLLLDPSEIADGRALLRGRRAGHLHRVLGVTVGQTLVAGRLGREHGTATILEVDAERVVVAYQPEPEPRAVRQRDLVLAVPRPKVLSRCLQHAAALGYCRIALIRSTRVDRSHLLSHKLEPTHIRQPLILGLEQARRVQLPSVDVFDRFKPFVEDVLPGWLRHERRFVAHPGSHAEIPDEPLISAEYALAIGPEGGFVPYEIDALTQRGFHAISSPVGALRVESALSYFTGHLDGLTRTRRR